MSTDLRKSVFWSSDFDITCERQHREYVFCREREKERAGPRQCWNMPTYSASGPGVRTQTILKYAYVLSTRARSPDTDNVEICLRTQHPGPESRHRQCWNMPTYSAPGPGVRTQTMLKYAYVFSTRARSPDSDNVEICLRTQHPGPESGPRQCWNMPTYSAPGPGDQTQTILKYVALKIASKNENVCGQECVIGCNLSARFWFLGFKTLKIFRPE